MSRGRIARLSFAEFGGDSDLSVRGEADDGMPLNPLPRPFRAVGVPLVRPRYGSEAGPFPGDLPTVFDFAFDERGSSSLINNLRGSSRGTKRPPSPPGVTALVPGVRWRVEEAKKSAGLLLILVAVAETLGRILPPPWGVSDLGVMRAIGFGGPAEGGARIRWVRPTLYSGSGVTLGASGMLPYGLAAPDPVPAGCTPAAPCCADPSRLDVPKPPKAWPPGWAVDGPGVEPNSPPPPPNAGVELAAPKAGVDMPPKPGVAPNVDVVGAGELNWNAAGFGVAAAPPNENAGVEAWAGAAPKAGAELAANVGVDEAPPKADPPPNAGIDDPKAGTELVAPNAGAELAAPNAGVEVVAPNAGVEAGAPKALPPNAGVGAAVGAPKAGVELGAPNAGAELAPNAGVDEGAPNAGVDVAPKAPPPPKAGVGAAPNAGAELAPKAGVDAADPKVPPPPNDDVLGAPNVDVWAGAPNAVVAGDWVAPPNGVLAAGWLPNIPPVWPAAPAC